MIVIVSIGRLIMLDERQNKIKCQNYHNAKATEGRIIVEDSKECNGRKSYKKSAEYLSRRKKAITVIEINQHLGSEMRWPIYYLRSDAEVGYKWEAGPSSGNFYYYSSGNWFAVFSVAQVLPDSSSATFRGTASANMVSTERRLP